MAINAKNVTPGKAARFILTYVQGAMKIREENPAYKLLSIYLQGEPGVGKTAIAKMIAKTLGYYMEDIPANQFNPDDAGGVRMPNVDTKTTDWYRPQWLPNADGTVVKDGVTYKGTVLFFDELASADDRVRKPLFSTFLDRRLNGVDLPDNCIVLAAGNEAETGTQVFELDNATRSRFFTLRIIADFTSWMNEYAPHAEITPSVIAHLKNNMGDFCQTEKALSEGLDLYGNPRTWEHISMAERAIMFEKTNRSSEFHLEVLEAMIAGKAGEAIAAQFMATFSIVSQMTSLYDLLEAKRKGQKDKIANMWPKQLSQLYALSYSMMSYPKDVATGIEVFELMDMFPEKTDLPFQESIPAIHEVVLKRLIESGADKKEMAKFASWNKKTVDAAITGPLIRIEM